jgi:hypothetical protein
MTNVGFINKFPNRPARRRVPDGGEGRPGAFSQGLLTAACYGYYHPVDANRKEPEMDRKQRSTSIAGAQPGFRMASTGGLATAAIATAILVTAGCAQTPWMPCEPGSVDTEIGDSEFRLADAAIEARWRVGDEWASSLEDRWGKSRLPSAGEPFVIVLRGGRSIPASSMKAADKPPVESILPRPDASCAVEALPGKAVRMNLLDEETGLRVTWRAVMRDGANYVRTEVTLQPTKADVDVKEVVMIDLPAPEAQVVGTVPGSPVVAGSWFFGLEHPMSINKASDGRVRCSIERALPLRSGQTATYSSVCGVTPANQLRRGFLRYIERERAHPYRTFLHYNSWYDIAYGTQFNEGQCLERIKVYGQELVQKRGVKLDSFLFDDGWDDTATIWEFHKGFPNGFSSLKQAATEVGGAPGVWFSPWGGYGPSREQRLATGKKNGYEIDAQGFALSGPKYYQRFRIACLEFVEKYGVNQFKLDGTGSPDKQFPGSAFGSDFEAAIQLISDLRKARPDLFINLTTGTWPSPFWTRYADSIWRGGEDHSFAGVGSDRQKWITYRDGDTWAGVVKKGPLYPLNALMLHGLIFADHAGKLNTDAGNDFRDEVRSYFGSGTHLQEMYITPSLLKPGNWDDLAEAAKWSRANADVLADTHWVGGDPTKLEVYGWASWSPRKGILVLRNPSDKPQSFAVDVALVFELPEAIRDPFIAHSPWAEDKQNPPIEFVPGKPTTIDLKPFEVIVLEAGRK